jgi:hypothetical protein
LLANLVAGETATKTLDGGVVSLDPTTQVSFSGHETTLGDLALAVDARLAQLETANLNDPSVRDEYGRIADGLGAFNEGNGMPVTCPSGSGSLSARPGAMLLSASPNPFRATTTLDYAVAAGETADIGVFDLNGRLVKRLATNGDGSGARTTTWDGTNTAGMRVRAGVYFVRGHIGEQPVRAQVLMLR